jgi:hypothetical protein
MNVNTASVPEKNEKELNETVSKNIFSMNITNNFILTKAVFLLLPASIETLLY